MLSPHPYWALIAAAVFAYLIGGLPFGYWFVQFSSGQDIRTMGSGNIGATNVHRSAGKKAGFIVLFLDILKGFLAIWAAAALSGDSALGLAIAWVAVMVGHCYPAFLRFKGGKAVACFAGAALYLAPWALLGTAAVFVAVVAFSKYISLGSVLGALVFPVLYWAIYRPLPVLLMAAVLASALVIYRHKGNLARLRAGKENVFSLKGKTP